MQDRGIKKADPNGCGNRGDVMGMAVALRL